MGASLPNFVMGVDSVITDFAADPIVFNKFNHLGDEENEEMAAEFSYCIAFVSLMSAWEEIIRNFEFGGFSAAELCHIGTSLAFRATLVSIFVWYLVCGNCHMESFALSEFIYARVSVGYIEWSVAVGDKLLTSSEFMHVDYISWIVTSCVWSIASVITVSHEALYGLRCSVSAVWDRFSSWTYFRSGESSALCTLLDYCMTSQCLATASEVCCNAEHSVEEYHDCHAGLPDLDEYWECVSDTFGECISGDDGTWASLMGRGRARRCRTQRWKAPWHPSRQIPDADILRHMPALLQQLQMEQCRVYGVCRRLHDVPGRGNCMWHALAALSHCTWHTVKKRVLRTMKRNGIPSEIVRSMSVSRTWGNALAIATAVRVFSQSIAVLHDGEITVFREHGCTAVPWVLILEGGHFTPGTWQCYHHGISSMQGPHTSDFNGGMMAATAKMRVLWMRLSIWDHLRSRGL